MKDKHVRLVVVASLSIILLVVVDYHVSLYRRTHTAIVEVDSSTIFHLRLAHRISRQHPVSSIIRKTFVVSENYDRKFAEAIWGKTMIFAKRGFTCTPDECELCKSLPELEIEYYFSDGEPLNLDDSLHSDDESESKETSVIISP